MAGIQANGPPNQLHGRGFWQDFLSHFNRGVMMPNIYEVVFDLPPGVDPSKAGPAVESGIYESTMRRVHSALNGVGSINVKCHTATFPQRTMQTFEIKQNTTPFRAPFSAIYDPVTFSFYSNANGDSRVYFDIWQRAVFNVESNTMNFYREFTSDVDIYVHNLAGVRTYGVRLFEAWPLSVGPLDVSYSQVDNYQTVPVTLAYRRWQQILNNGEVF